MQIILDINHTLYYTASCEYKPLGRLQITKVGMQEMWSQVDSSPTYCAPVPSVPERAMGSAKGETAMHLMEHQIGEIRELVRQYAVSWFDGFRGVWSAGNPSERQQIIDIIEVAQRMGESSVERNKKAEEFYSDVVQKQAELVNLLRDVATVLGLRGKDDSTTLRSLTNYVKTGMKKETHG